MGQDGDGNGNWARRRRNDDNEDDGKKTCTKNTKIDAGFVMEEYLLAVEVLNALWQNNRISPRAIQESGSVLLVTLIMSLMNVGASK